MKSKIKMLIDILMTIILLCPHGRGRFGQSLTAITKFVSDAAIGEALHYSDGSNL